MLCTWIGQRFLWMWRQCVAGRTFFQSCQLLICSQWDNRQQSGIFAQFPTRKTSTCRATLGSRNEPGPSTYQAVRWTSAPLLPLQDGPSTASFFFLLTRFMVHCSHAQMRFMSAYVGDSGFISDNFWSSIAMCFFYVLLCMFQGFWWWLKDPCFRINGYSWTCSLHCKFKTKCGTFICMFFF